MTISKTQPMRPAEIELVDTVNGYSTTISNVETEMEQVNGHIETLISDMDNAQTDIGNLQTSLASTENDVTELQGDVTTAESNIEALQGALNALSNIETVNYLEYISVASGSGVTISSASLKRWGKVCLLVVNYSIASANAIASGNWKNIFDITGPYAPIAGFTVPAAVNDKSAAAMINNTNTMWIKAYNAAHSGSHYVGAIYLTN